MNNPFCSSFGWAKSGDMVHWRSSFDDVDRMLDNFNTLTPLINDLIAGPATMDRLEVIAPKTSMDKIKNSIPKGYSWSTEYYESDNDAFASGYVSKSSEMRLDEWEGGAKTQSSMVTSEPFYTIKDWPAARPIVRDIIDKTVLEPGCKYFAWTKNGDKVRQYIQRA
jgi:hypothetical protein